MADYFAIVIGLALVNQFVLARTAAAGPFPLHPAALAGTSLRLLAITAVVTGAALIGSLLDRWVIAPLDLGTWRLAADALVIVALAELAEKFLARDGSRLGRDPESDLPLITINSVALGLMLLLIADELSLAGALLYGAGTGVTFAAVTLMLNGLRERLDAADIPASWRGAAIIVVSAGMLSLALTGLSGIVRN